MRILILNWYDPTNPAAGGAERYLIEIASRLARDGHQVTWACGSFAGAAENDWEGGVRVVRFPVNLGNLAWYAANLIVRACRLYLSHRGEYDLVLDCVNKVPFFTPLYVRSPRVALQHHFNGQAFDAELPRGLRLLAKCLERGYFRLIYSREHFVTVSRSTQAELARYGIRPRSNAVVYNAIQVPVPSIIPARSSYPMVVTVGRLQKYKRVDTLIGAMRQVLEAEPNARLHILGAGRELTHLRNLVDQFGLKDRVIFEGRVSEERKFAALGEAWVHATTSKKEGWGISVLEAGVMGTPTVATRVPGLAESVRHMETGLLVDVASEAEIARAILTVIQDRMLAESMGRQAREFARQFDWDTSARVLSSYLHRVVQARTPNSTWGSAAIPIAAAGAVPQGLGTSGEPCGVNVPDDSNVPL